jgi:hypothetical protein
VVTDFRFILQVSDWRFPYKRSHHPVCIHAGQILTEFVLKDCDVGVQPGTELYVFPQATACKCHTCKSSEASCEGYRYRDFQFISTDEVWGNVWFEEEKMRRNYDDSKPNTTSYIYINIYIYIYILLLLSRASVFLFPISFVSIIYSSFIMLSLSSHTRHNTLILLSCTLLWFSSNILYLIVIRNVKN